MNQMLARFWRTCMSVFLLISLLSSGLSAPRPAYAMLDFTPVATDPLGDMTEPNLDLHRLGIWEDTENFYIAFDAYASTWGMTYGVYIDSDQETGSGATSDPWGRSVDAVADHLPEHTIYVYHNEDDTLGDAQLNHWNGSIWSFDSLVSQGGTQTYDAAGNTIEYKIPKTALGSPTRIAVEVFTTGGDGHAQDTVPSDPNVAFTTPDWNSGNVTTLSSFYVFPEPELALTVTSPTEGQAFSSADITVIGTVDPAEGSTVSIDLNDGADVFTPTVGANGAFSQAVKLSPGNNTLVITAQNGTAQAAVTRHVSFGASHDDNIFWSDLGHNSRDPLYRNPGGAVVIDTPVTLRLRAAKGDLTDAKVRVWNDRLDQQSVLTMYVAASDAAYDWWEAAIPASDLPTVFWYRFIVTDGTKTDYYEDDPTRDGGWGEVFEDSMDNSWQITVYDPGFTTPDWVKDAVIYQIFPDRFRDGDAANNTPEGTFFYEEDGTIFRSNTTDWNTVVCDPRADTNDTCEGSYSRNFYGGDLKGILDQLDYIEGLGVTAIYLNPIFESPSNHKYDTTNFGLIDDNFGVLGDYSASLELFETLAAQAAQRGIGLILDGVFNHTSSDSVYFDRYGRYIEVGACESAESPYRDWYYFTDVTPGTGTCVSSTGEAQGATYESWFGYDSLPKLNAQNQEVRELIWAGDDAIASFWLASSPDSDRAGGWRLDVAGDVDPGVTANPANDYWEGFRAVVRAADPDAYIVGEEWGNAASWLLGNEWDASMNYQFGTAIMGFWRDEPFVDNDHNEASSAGIINPLTPSQLDSRLKGLQERAAPEAFYAMMNLLGSHDTNRALFMLDHNADQNDAGIYQTSTYDWSDAIQRLKGVWLLQMTMPGAPTTYYGDEVGLVGPVAWDGTQWQDDPYNRQPFPWLDASGTPFYTHLQTEGGQDALRDYYKTLTAVRNAHPALRTGSFDTLLVDDSSKIYAYGRKMDDNSDAAVVIVNGSENVQPATVTLAGYLPTGTVFDDALTTAVETYIPSENGELTVSLPARSGVVLIATAGLQAAPDAVTDLSTVEASGQVTLNWTAAANADSYIVYRSLLSGGGYEQVGTSTTTTFADTGLENGTTYYYVVVSQDDTSLLTSGYSNEIEAVPHEPIGWASIQYPASITHTISAVVPTETIYGRVYIEGVTNQPGATAGLLAQVGYGPDGSDPADNSEWVWVDAQFNVNVGNDDEYMASLLPEATGTFDYAYRFSTTGGRDWVYADLDGTSDGYAPEDAGALTVIASDDTTAPDAPTNLNVTDWSTSYITLEWDAVEDEDLYAYDIFRSTESGANYTKVGRVLAGTETFTDDTVTSGVTYYYIVRALDESFNVSADSNVVSGEAVAKTVEVTFRVGVPAYTPGDIYLVGNVQELGAWNPGQIKMTKVNDTTWETTVTLPEGQAIEYKYTRGSWDTVESWGSITGLTNRRATVAYGEDGTQVIDNTATDWGVGADDSKAVQLWVDPLVVDHSPAAGATDVPPGSMIHATFSISMADNTSITVTGPGDVVIEGLTFYAESTKSVLFYPDGPLTPGATYKVTVSGQQSAGGAQQQVPYEWTFTVGDLMLFLPLVSNGQ